MFRARNVVLFPIFRRQASYGKRGTGHDTDFIKWNVEKINENVLSTKSSLNETDSDSLECYGSCS